MTAFPVANLDLERLVRLDQRIDAHEATPTPTPPPSDLNREADVPRGKPMKRITAGVLAGLFMAVVTMTAAAPAHAKSDHWAKVPTDRSEHWARKAN